MQTAAAPRTDEATQANGPAAQHRVRTDLRAGATVLAVVIGGHLVWAASGTTIIAALSRR